MHLGPRFVLGMILTTEPGSYITVVQFVTSVSMVVFGKLQMCGDVSSESTSWFEYLL